MARTWEGARLMGVALDPSPRWGFGMTSTGRVRWRAFPNRLCSPGHSWHQEFNCIFPP